MSDLYGRSGLRLSQIWGNEADPDIPMVKTPKNAIHNNIGEIYETEVRLYTGWMRFSIETKIRTHLTFIK